MGKTGKLFGSSGKGEGFTQRRNGFSKVATGKEIESEKQSRLRRMGAGLGAFHAEKGRSRSVERETKRRARTGIEGSRIHESPHLEPFDENTNLKRELTQPDTKYLIPTVKRVHQVAQAFQIV